MKMVSLLLALVFGLAYASASSVPALFIFGDSVVDAGNNNRLLTIARANYPPYGMSFPQHMPTGRFSDGKLVPDFIAQFLGLPMVPPYYGVGINILKGVNFASASSGILPETHVMGALPLHKQVDNFAEIHGRLMNMLGVARGSHLISKSIFYINDANNDVNNYFRKDKTLPHSVKTAMLKELSAQITRLYNMGARKFVIVGLSATGCIPINQVDGHCGVEAQIVAKDYNTAQDMLLDELRAGLKGAVFVRPNFYKLMVEMKTNPTKYGFKDATKSCCEISELIPICLETAPHCSNPSKFVYFDGIHPTEHFNEIAAYKWWSGNKDDVYPINIHQLASL